MLDPDDFLLKDYELKISYLTNHFTRMWNRFNYFVTVETALFTGKILLPNSEPAWAFPLLGLGPSLGWYLVAAQDRYLIRIYRRQIDKVAERLEQRLYAQDPDSGTLIAVGGVESTAEALKAIDEKQPASLSKLFNQVTGWRSESLSTTHMAVWFPIVLTLVWAVLFLRVFLH